MDKTSRDKALRSANARANAADERKQWAWDHAAEVYRERDYLIGALARVYPSHIMQHTRGAKKPALCIHTPAGQLSWVISDDLAPLVADLELTPNDWDGAKVTDRHERLKILAQSCNKSTDTA